MCENKPPLAGTREREKKKRMRDRGSNERDKGRRKKKRMNSNVSPKQMSSSMKLFAMEEVIDSAMS